MPKKNEATPQMIVEAILRRGDVLTMKRLAAEFVSARRLQVTVPCGYDSITFQTLKEGTGELPPDLPEEKDVHGFL